MGAFFTNVQVRIPEGDEGGIEARIRAVIARQVAEDGMAIVEDGAAGDREMVVVVGARWVAFYDVRAEDQDDTIVEWARALSAGLGTDAISVLCHDSDVVQLTRFAAGKRRDRYDSNPRFSGKRPSKLSPEARAAVWADLLAPGRSVDELVAAFAYRGVHPERALETFAAAIGAEPALVRVGYRYLADEQPAGRVVRIRAAYKQRPAWEARATGAPTLVSQWAVHGMDPPAQPPLQVFAGQAVHATAIAMNRGGAAQGLRIEIERSSDAVTLARVEVVIAKPGRFQMDRYDAPLVQTGDRFVAELPAVALQPGFTGAMHALVDAGLEALMDAQHAGQIHLNLHGTATHAGAAALAVTMVPLANPSGAHAERVAVEVTVAEGAPLRARGELSPSDLEPLGGDSHVYALVVLDAPHASVRDRATAVLESLRMLWPKGAWHGFASSAPADESATFEARGGLADARVWRTLTTALADAVHFDASCTKSDGTQAGFELDLTAELGAFAVWMPAGNGMAQRVLVDAVDALARTGTLVQAIVTRWQLGAGGVTTAYESAVGLSGHQLASRAWATRWLRGVGKGHVWLGEPLLAHIAATGEPIGPTRRLTVDDVAATERALAALLPSEEDFTAYLRARRSRNAR